MEGSAYHRIINELKERKVEFVDKFAPYYAASIGCHIFNMHNKENHIYAESGLIPDMRLHQFFVAPPGFSKTFILRHFLESNHSILEGTAIRVGFEQMMTEAGFCGTIGGRDDNGNPVLIPGIAETEANSIIGIEEFAAVTAAMQATHSSMLDTALLTALDRGEINKKLAAGPIKVKTQMSLWAASQPLRFDLTSGMARRFWFHLFVPGLKDLQALRLARRRGKNIFPNKDRLDGLKEVINQKVKSVKLIRRLDFDKSIYHALDAMNVIHYEEPLYERLALGYTIMNSNKLDIVKVTADATLINLFKQGHYSRMRLKRGTDIMQIYIVVKDSGGSMLSGELKKRMLDFGVDWERATKLIILMQRLKIIKVDMRGKVTLAERSMESIEEATNISPPDN